MADKNQVKLKTVDELMDEVEDISANLKELPDIIELLIERYGLANAELTQNQKYDLVEQHSRIYNTLALIQRILWDTNDDFSKLTARKE